MAALALSTGRSTYNPLSLVIRSRGLLESAFASDGTTIRWVLSLGSNKALEFLNAGSTDIGSTAGAAALVGRVNGNPIKVVATFSRPEWTALVSVGAASVGGPADLKGRRVTSSPSASLPGAVYSLSE